MPVGQQVTSRTMKALSHLIFFTLSMNFYFVCGYGDEEDLLEILRENLTNYSPPPDLFNRTVFIDLELTQFLEVNEGLFQHDCFFQSKTENIMS